MQGLTKSHVADAIGVTVPVIGRVEIGENNNPETIKLMADFLKVPMEEIVEIIDDDSKSSAA